MVLCRLTLSPPGIASEAKGRVCGELQGKKAHYGLGLRQYLAGSALPVGFTQPLSVLSARWSCR